MCTYMHVCTYVCTLHVHVYVHECVYVTAHVSVYAYMFVTGYSLCCTRGNGTHIRTHIHARVTYTHTYTHTGYSLCFTRGNGTVYGDGSKVWLRDVNMTSAHIVMPTGTNSRKRTVCTMTLISKKLFCTGLVFKL